MQSKDRLYASFERVLFRETGNRLRSSYPGDDPLAPEEYEREMHEVVPGSQYIALREAGHFPMAEQPTVVNQAIAAFLETAGAVDPARLEANLSELRDENTRAASLVKLGEVRIRTAKAAR